MDRKQYFEELHIALTREGFTSQPKQGELLPVEWGGLPLCRITADGGVRYWQEDVATPERERACERATDLACTVREYMTLLEQAPPLQALSLTDDYRLLADFNGAVLATHPTRLGVQFVTWDWSFDHTGLNQGNYFQENYVGAKQKTMQVPSRTSPSAPASFPNSKSSIRSSLSKSTGAALTP